MKKIRKAEIANLGMLIGLFIFILIGVVLLPVITSEVSQLTTPTTVVSGTVTSTIPAQVSGSNAIILSLVPLFYILVLLIVPAVVLYKLYKG